MSWYSEKLHIAKAFKSMAKSINTDMNIQKRLVGILEYVQRATESVCIQAYDLHDILLECAETSEKRVVTSEGYRAATLKELNLRGYELKTTVYSKLTCNIENEENVKHIAMLQWMINGSMEAYGRAGYYTSQKTMGAQLEEARDGVVNAVKYVLEGGFDKDLPAIREGKDKLRKYEETAETKAYSLVKLIAETERLISKYGYTNDYQKTTHNIIKDYKKRNHKKRTYDLSHKQLASIRYTYLSLRKMELEDGESTFTEYSIKIDGLSDEDNDIIIKMMNNEDRLAGKDTEFAYRILRSVIRFKKCSEKQMNVIRDTFKKVEIMLDEQIVEVDTSAVFSDEVFNPYEEEVSVDRSDVFSNDDNKFRKVNFEMSEEAPKLSEIYEELDFEGKKDSILGI